ncbi:MAG: serine/threonine protein kinase [Alphaproteobacteria bacterium]|nr:serine/threonine protein kinase [Alphaproteobacteria bacterium]
MSQSQFQPELFGKYYLVDKVAVGGMAEIFKAKTFSTAGFEKLQVIKRILSHLSDNEEFVSMFIDEAKISVSLQHANLVQIYDFGKIHENYFIAMEWVDGKDVKQILRKLAQKRKLLPEEFAVFLAHEICKGLDYAHKKTNLQGEPLGIIHRDMSPSNVLVSYSGEVKVADFGIAKAEMSQYNTKDGVLKGKFEYMSPEQARGEEVTQQSDLFSVGIILYEMLTGRRLFKSDNEIKTLEKIKSVAIRPPSALNPNIPQRLDDLVMRALTAEPADRYQDAREFQQELLEYMYPSTPPVIQRSLAMFMEQLFAEERADERDRLEAGTVLALQLHAEQQRLEAERKAAADEWDGDVGSSASIRTETRAGPPLALLALILLLLVAVGVLAWRALNPEEPTVVEVEVSPTTGALLIRVRPVEAKVFAGQRLIGTGTQVDVGDLPPGDMTLRFEADGYQIAEETVTVVAGERLVLPVTLQPDEPEPPPEITPPNPPEEGPQTPVASDPTTFTFESSPSGATVKLGGAVLGTTPFDWDGARTNKSYRITYSLDGYDPVSFSAKSSSTDGETFSRSLKKTVAATGQVNITLDTTKRWADIFVDGKKVGQTPLFKHELPAGTHSIRAVNESIGLDKTQSVTVGAGETARVVFSLE